MTMRSPRLIVIFSSVQMFLKYFKDIRLYTMDSTFSMCFIRSGSDILAF